MYKRQMMGRVAEPGEAVGPGTGGVLALTAAELAERAERPLSLIHISEPTRPY